MRLFDSVKRLVSGASEQKSFSISDHGIYSLFGVSPSQSGAIVNSSTALHVPAVLHAVRLIAETIGSLPCKLYRDDDGSKEGTKDHPAYRLVHRRANPWTSAGQLRVDLTVDALLHGAGFAQVVRLSGDRPFELHRLKPSTVQCFTEDDGEPYYLVQPAKGRQVRLPYRDVLYVAAFGGAAPVKLGKNAIGVAMTLERHASQFFGSGARPSGIISNEKPAGGDVGAKTIANIRKAWRAWQADSNGDPLILDAGWSYDQPAMTSTDAQFLEHRLEQVREIARIFGVPPHMLFELSRATWSNAEQMAASFLQLCLRPWLDRWQDALTTVLLSDDEQDDHYFEFVIDDLQRADAAGRAEIFSKLIASRVMTPNEARAAMNLPAIEGGDELANPYTTTNQAAGQLPAASNDNTEQNEAAA